MVSIHDVAPATDRECAALVDALADAAIPLTQLVIAGPWRGEGLVGGDGRATEVLGWLRQRRDAGDEVSLHGWLHRADHSTSAIRRLVGNIAARGVGELWELDRQTTAQRASLGLDLLRRNGLNAIGCTPPGWLVSRQARLGLADAGLGYVTDHAGLVDLATGRRWNALALCQRPARIVDGGTASRTSLALERIGMQAVSLAERLMAAGRSVRIALHPDDVARPHLVESAVDAVRACLARGAVARTYADVLADLRAGG